MGIVYKSKTKFCWQEHNTRLIMSWIQWVWKLILEGLF